MGVWRMSIIHEVFLQRKQIEDRVTGLFKSNKISEVYKKQGFYNIKSKGVAITDIMVYLISLVFTNKSMYMNIQNGTHEGKFKRDVVYRFLNAACINWCMYLLQLAASVIKPIRRATSDGRLCALVVDDSLYPRPRSKCVELLANVHDHTSTGKGRFVRGFRMLTMGWTDGATFIPLMFRHMSSQNAKSRYNEINPNIDKRSHGYQARKQAVSGTTEVMLWMLKQAKKFRIPAKHVLFDSWFSFPSTMVAVAGMGFHSVGRLKDTKKIKYIDGGVKKTLKEIYASHRKRPGNSKYLLKVGVLLYNDKGETAPGQIVFVRDRKNSGKWIALGTTDTTLTEETVIQLYGKRWDIEVFFKMCKSYLKLAGEFQGISYDCVTAHTAIVMTRYILLASDKRHNEDSRTIGELFHSCYDEMPDISFNRALTIMMDALHSALSDCIFLSEAEVDVIIDAFISATQENLKVIFAQNKHLSRAA
jgi:hypothetical protein